MSLKSRGIWFAFSCLSLLAYYGAACGGGSDSGAAATTPTTGSGINSTWTSESLKCTGTVTGGTFSSGTGATVNVGSMPTCVNATTDPTITATTTQPSGLDIRTTEGDVNVTTGSFYAFTINGDRGFTTTSASAVSVMLPFDPTLIATVPDRTNSVKVFVRIFNQDDNALIDVTGTISGGTITITTRGLPKNFTAAVIYNPDMDTTTPDSPAPSISVGKGVLKTLTDKPPWPAKTWCAIYNPKSTVLIDAVSTKDGITSPTAAQIKTAIKTYIANNAVAAQTIYEAAGFRAPNLFIATTATEPCTTLGTTPRFTIHVIESGSYFQGDDDKEAITPDGNHYGREYINAARIKDSASKASGDLGSIKASVAHEMQHAIQYGYEIYGSPSKGYKEAASTSYGMTIDQGGTITVRSGSPEETFAMSDFLMDYDTTTTAAAYSNQDFFAYVGKQYNSGSLSFIVGLWEQISDDIDLAALGAVDTATADSIRQSPTLPMMASSMDLYFRGKFGSSLEDIYLDFLKQRTMDHNANSQFGRVGETTTGFAKDLFTVDPTDSTKDSLQVITINPTDCTVTDGSGGFGSVAPMAARAVRIVASGAAATTTYPTITLTLKPQSGAMNDKWAGYYRRTGSAKTLTDSNTFTSFGAAATDEIDLVVANVTQDTPSSITYEAKCEGAGGGGGGGSAAVNTFAIDTFTLPTESTWIPAYADMMPDMGSGISIAAVAATSDIMNMVAYQNIQIQFNTSLVTGPGTYTIIGNDPTVGAAAVLYSPGTTAALAGGHYVYSSISGTVTLSAWGTAIGDHITGTFTSTLQETDTTPSKSGGMSGTFDFVVGAANVL